MQFTNPGPDALFLYWQNSATRSLEQGRAFLSGETASITSYPGHTWAVMKQPGDASPRFMTLHSDTCKIDLVSGHQTRSVASHPRPTYAAPHPQALQDELRIWNRTQKLVHVRSSHGLVRTVINPGEDAGFSKHASNSSAAPGTFQVGTQFFFTQPPANDQLIGAWTAVAEDCQHIFIEHDADLPALSVLAGKAPDHSSDYIRTKVNHLDRQQPKPQANLFNRLTGQQAQPPSQTLQQMLCERWPRQFSPYPVAVKIKFVSQNLEAVQLESSPQHGSELVLMPGDEMVIDTCVGATWTAKSLVNVGPAVPAILCQLMTVKVSGSRMLRQPWETSERVEHACYVIA